MRLVSANLCSGRRPDGTVALADDLAAATAALGADVLALQEVDAGLPRSGRVDQAAAAAAGMHHRFVRTVRGTPVDRRRDATPEGGYGIALATALPVLEWHELRLAPAPGRYPLPIPSRPPGVLLLKEEPRAAVAAVLSVPGATTLTVACTHLSYVPGINAYQLRRVLSWLAGLPGPRVLLGDLNLPPRVVRVLTRGWAPLAAAATYPALDPRVQLDHALAHEYRGTATSEAVRMPLSDHLALAVDLAF